MDWKKLSTTKIYEVYKRLFLNRCYLCNAKSENTLCLHCQEGLPLKQLPSLQTPNTHNQQPMRAMPNTPATLSLLYRPLSI
jgi:hypothetical protein